ncbi:MAG: DUF2147 domain-containing protein [Spirochaetales bacterium]|uniref:DUF2147 domain-containing protein n=1 Tax=Candidatus Thalassospirochaeta sargassi TaxID=3119039 RepID=A0AAJ1MI76_9SPIO|nr:DUF2147 domain-containing protein [Spirochaetales bacterium]
MKKFLLSIIVISLMIPAGLFAAEDITGLWKTVDDETGNPKGVVAVYEYNGKIYGRVIASFDDDGKYIDDDMYRQLNTSPYLVGDPAFNALTIIWDMVDRGRKWGRGKIMDPGNAEEKKPGIYDCEMWKDGDTLVVRGKILMFGRNQTWYPMDNSEFPDGFVIPDWKSFKPEIPKLKK